MSEQVFQAELEKKNEFNLSNAIYSDIFLFRLQQSSEHYQFRKHGTKENSTLAKVS